MESGSHLKWGKGTAYGPVLNQTDLYLLNANAGGQMKLHLHPILQGTDPKFLLMFDLVSGNASGLNPSTREQEIAWTSRDEPATLPRVTQLYILTQESPWCTIVKSENGVTMGDVCQTVWKDYTENWVTDSEFSSLAPRFQEQIRRTSQNRSLGGGWNGGYGYPSTPGGQGNRFKRLDWLREKVFFDRMEQDDAFTEMRLGFKAPNVFIMRLTA